jgi:hypothetical protein
LQGVFLPGEKREEYLSGEPADDDSFIGVFAHELEHSGGYTPEKAKEVARKLLPDILSYNPREPVRYPDNGRTLTDDVVDLFFSILFCYCGLALRSKKRLRFRVTITCASRLVYTSCKMLSKMLIFSIVQLLFGRTF